MRGVPGVVVADVAHLHILGPVWSSGQADQHVAGGHPPWSGGGGGGWGESDKHGGVRWLVRTGPAAAAGNHLRHHYHRSSRRTICVGDGRWAMGGVACLQPPFTFFFLWCAVEGRQPKREEDENGNGLSVNTHPTMCLTGNFNHPTPVHVSVVYRSLSRLCLVPQNFQTFRHIETLNIANNACMKY